jgi:hypothetical protein
MIYSLNKEEHGHHDSVAFGFQIGIGILRHACIRVHMKPVLKHETCDCVQCVVKNSMLIHVITFVNIQRVPIVFRSRSHKQWMYVCACFTKLVL